MTSKEIYELLCVPDIDLKELTTLLNLIEAIHLSIPPEEAQWLINKFNAVKIEMMSRDPVIEKLKKRAKENKASKKALPPSDDRYTDYTQSE